MGSVTYSGEQDGDPRLSGAAEIPSTRAGGADLNGQHWGHLPQAGDRWARRKGLAPSEGTPEAILKMKVTPPSRGCWGVHRAPAPALGSADPQASARPWAFPVPSMRPLRPS